VSSGSRSVEPHIYYYYYYYYYDPRADLDDVEIRKFLTLPGVLPTSYPMGSGALSPGVKRPGREADHSPPANAEDKKTWIYISTPPYAFMAWYLISSAQGQLYLLLY
jgi:hypothetical protein